MKVKQGMKKIKGERKFKRDTSVTIKLSRAKLESESIK